MLHTATLQLGGGGAVSSGLLEYTATLQPRARVPIFLRRKTDTSVSWDWGGDRGLCLGSLVY